MPQRRLGPLEIGLPGGYDAISPDPNSVSDYWTKPRERGNGRESGSCPVIQTPGPLAVSRQQAAQMLNISVTEVDDERRAGRLVARRHGRKVLIEVVELRRWLEALPADQMRFAPEPDDRRSGR